MTRTARLAALGALLGAVLCTGMVLRTSEAVFTADTRVPDNAWETGSVSLADDSTGSALFATTSYGGGVPGGDGLLTGGDTLTRCLTVTYTGTLTSDVAVRLYATADGTLAPHLDVVVDEGTGSGRGCGSFVASRTLYSGTLAGLATVAHDGASGLGPWEPGATGATRVYRFTITVQPVTAAQAAQATASFVWEATG
ncbi:hypothetical protein [Cellulomonas oligotrophica]|uniref:Camelysin metallo-endopeptidase n=1 Tax=Cellulomonas oligotrophica TaxID=931536 RepID=A0A7Y9JZI6_9CELL|nr:hypothetical protein [Cellulomonas oligotrophica]NYD86225.1 hypothetical protein [Cellulomonas oligotrophica]GIG34448.1 hypothetical protein Col01nite_36070 [Cellulomonas oligotrophica]